MRSHNEEQCKDRTYREVMTAEARTTQRQPTVRVRHQPTTAGVAIMQQHQGTKAAHHQQTTVQWEGEEIQFAMHLAATPTGIRTMRLTTQHQRLSTTMHRHRHQDITHLRQDITQVRLTITTTQVQDMCHVHATMAMHLYTTSA
jgi:hypothetical protein